MYPARLSIALHFDSKGPILQGTEDICYDLGCSSEDEDQSRGMLRVTLSMVIPPDSGRPSVAVVVISGL